MVVRSRRVRERWNGWTGLTTGGSWCPSATSRRPKPRNVTTPCGDNLSWRRDRSPNGYQARDSLQHFPFRGVVEFCNVGASTPSPGEIKLNCSCPDGAGMCKNG